MFARDSQATISLHGWRTPRYAPDRAERRMPTAADSSRLVPGLRPQRGARLLHGRLQHRCSRARDVYKRQAKSFAARLSEHHIAKGDKVIFWSENRPEWVAAFWGCVLVGAIVVPIDYRTSFQFLHRIHEIVDCRLILIGEDVHLPSLVGQPPV